MSIKTPLLVYAPFFHNIGFGIVGREIFKCLHRTGLFDLYMEVEPHPRLQRIIDLTEEEKRIFLHTPGYKNFPADKGIFLHFGNPIFYKKRGKFNFGFGMCESTRIRKVDVEHCNDIDGIFVPTQFSENAFRDSGVTKPLIQTFLGTDLKYFNLNPLKENQQKFANLSENSCNFNFFFNGGWHSKVDRKNISVLVDVFLKTFEKIENVGLILKLGSGCSCEHSQILCSQTMHRITAKYDIHRKKVMFIYGELGREILASLYKKCQCFVSATLGEGFCLPVIESLFCGKPVIVTGGSAPNDFLDHNLSWLVESERKQVPQPFLDLGMNPKAEFTFPKEEDLADAMQNVYECYSTWKEKALKQRQKVIHLSWENTTNKIMDYWEKVGILNSHF